MTYSNQTKIILLKLIPLKVIFSKVKPNLPIIDLEFKWRERIFELIINEEREKKNWLYKWLKIKKIK